MERLRVGVLGAARITPGALIKPAGVVAQVTVTAVAAREPARAREFAAKYGIGTVHDSYEALITDPEVDAVYNPLPNSLHAPWTLRAIAAGKHVLCEKPFASNEAEAAQVADAARSAGVVVMEAFHFRYHPLARRMQQIVAGELGELRHVEAALCFPLPRFSDIRYRFDLAGGATMDAGCYAITASGCSARASRSSWTRGPGCTARMSTGRWSPTSGSPAAPRGASAPRSGRPSRSGSPPRPSASGARCEC